MNQSVAREKTERQRQNFAVHSAITEPGLVAARGSCRLFISCLKWDNISCIAKVIERTRSGLLTVESHFPSGAGS